MGALRNLLETASAEDKVAIPNISLMVFDECHHCAEKHAYNRLPPLAPPLRDKPKVCPIVRCDDPLPRPEAE